MVKYCGMEDRTVVAYGCGRQKSWYVAWKEKEVVANGRLPSPAAKGVFLSL